MDRWLNSHWFARAVALLLACMLWMVVNLESEPGSSTEVGQPMIIEGVELHPVYDSERFAIVKIPKTVKVALQTDNPFYRIISPDSYEVFVDASGLGKGAHRVPVQHKGFPGEARVEVTPSFVDIVLEEKKTVEREVKVEFTGQVAPSYTYGQALVKPFKVLVRVPESQEKSIGFVKAIIDLRGATEEIATTVPVKVFDKAGNPMPRVEVNPLAVEVTVPVTSPFREVPIKLNLTNDLPDGYSLASMETTADTVTVFGPEEYINSLETYAGPTINLATIKSDSVLELNIPKQGDVVKVEPESMKVTIKIVPSATKRLTVPLRVTGLQEGNTAKVLGRDGQVITTIDFDMIGAPQILKDLTPEDVQVVADVSGLSEGIHEVKINYNLNQPFYLKPSPAAIKQVTVEISKPQVP